MKATERGVMFSVERDPFGPGPTEEELRAALVEANKELADINNEVGRVLAEQRIAQHRVREAGKALQLALARKVRDELAEGWGSVAGTGPRAEGRRR